MITSTGNYRLAGLLLAGLVPILALACTRALRPTPRPEGHLQPSRIDSETARRAVATARSLLATPYRRSGDDPRGFDCSGLVSFVFDSAGLALPRTAQRQSTVGRWVPPDELRAGDLVFFGETRETLFHVGLVVSSEGEPLRMIHASSSRGVVETEVLANSYWLPRLQFGRRILD